MAERRGWPRLMSAEIASDYVRSKPSGYYWEPSRKLRAMGFLPVALGKDKERALRRAATINERAARLRYPPHRPDLEPGDKPGAVYFLRGGNEVKIGYAGSINGVLKRRATLQVGHPQELTIICIIPGVDRDYERQLHGYFELHHLRGEWFNYSREIQKFVEGQNRVLAEIAKKAEARG